MGARAGIKRATWTRSLAQALRFKNPQDMRELLAKKGCKPPYEEEQVLRILEAEGYSTVAYHKQQQKKEALKTEPKKKNGATPGTAVVTMTEAAKRKEIALKVSATARMRLVHRLARLLPKGDTATGLYQVRKILAHHGIDRKDEHGAIALFKELRINIEKFEYANDANAPVEIPYLTPEQLKIILDRHLKEHPSYWQITAAGEARKTLTHWAKQMRLGMKLDAIMDVPRPHHLVFQALDELLAPPWDDVIKARSMALNEPEAAPKKGHPAV